MSVDAWQFSRLFDKTSQVDPKLRAALRRRLRRLANEAAREVQYEALKPGRTQAHGASRHADRGFLRAGIAGGVKVQMPTSSKSKRVGVFIKATGAALPASQRPMVRRWNRDKGFRHPVYGHRDRWVKQYGHPYFQAVLDAKAPGLAREVRAAMDEALTSLPIHKQGTGALSAHMRRRANRAR